MYFYCQYLDMKRLTLILFLVLPIALFGQDNDTIQNKPLEHLTYDIQGKVLNDANDKIMPNVHVINLNQVYGTVTESDGSFTISAAVNDTLFFSYLGFKSIRVRVTNDWFKYGDIKVKMTELSIALEEVQLNNIQLTGYLEVDAKIIPVYDNYRYRITGAGLGYEGGSTRKSAVSNVLNSVFNPVDFLYNVFGKRPKQMRKLRQMKEDNHIRDLLQDKFDRETLMVVLQLERVDIDEILRSCNFSGEFIQAASDLQILDAISDCYEQYRVLNRD